MIKTILHLVLTVVVLTAGILYARHLIDTAPEAERRPPGKTIPTVDVIEASPQSYTVQLITRGTVTPRTESTLIPQVAGQALAISDNFRAGGFFEKGEELLRIDPVDYELALTTAKAELAKMRLGLSEERAQAKQAESDWKKLGMKGKPDSLVMRKPQLANARASMASAEARVRRAEVDLERTRILAPYAGRIMEQQVDVGQYVSPGTVLAKIYATDYVEVRLPLTDRQLAFVDLPESYRGEAVLKEGPLVKLSSDLGGKTYTWEGRIVRTEGSIDTRSRQLFVIAQVDDPYAKDASGRPPLKIGQFVRAQITGQQLSDVFVLPRSLLSGTDNILIVDQDNKVQRREVEIVWHDAENIVVRSGLNSGDRIISTAMPYATDGAEIKLPGQTNDNTADFDNITRAGH